MLVLSFSHFSLMTLLPPKNVAWSKKVGVKGHNQKHGFLKKLFILVSNTNQTFSVFKKPTETIKCDFTDKFRNTDTALSSTDVQFLASSKPLICFRERPGVSLGPFTYIFIFIFDIFTLQYQNEHIMHWKPLMWSLWDHRLLKSDHNKASVYTNRDYIKRLLLYS